MHPDTKHAAAATGLVEDLLELEQLGAQRIDCCIVRGDAAQRYIAAGISTDHECFTAEEALDKLEHGMLIQIREGSAAKNFDSVTGWVTITRRAVSPRPSCTTERTETP